MSKQLLTSTFLAVVTMAFMSNKTALGQATCGPGPNWIDACTAAHDDTISTIANVGIDLNLDGQVDTTLILLGNMTVHRTGSMQNSVNFPGTRGGPGCCSNDNHACTTDTDCPGWACLNCSGSHNIADVSVTSVVLTNGTVTITAGSNFSGLTSLGVISETVNNNSQDNVRLDMVGKLDQGPGPNQFLFTHGPFTMQGVTDRVPFAEGAHLAGGPVDLYNQQVGGALVARLINLDHAPADTAGACCAFDGTQFIICLDNVVTPADCDQIAVEHGGDHGLYHAGKTCAEINSCVPAVSEWGIAVLSLLTLTAATIVIMRRRARAVA